VLALPGSEAIRQAERRRWPDKEVKKRDGRHDPDVGQFGRYRTAKLWEVIR
jgi:hypothetical protein